VVLILYGTGLQAAGTSGVTVAIGGKSAQVQFAGGQGAVAANAVNVSVQWSGLKWAMLVRGDCSLNRYMSLTISSRKSGNVEILVLAGRFTLGDGTGEFRDATRKTLESGTSILVDLSGVDYIDSAGLGELVAAYASATSRNLFVKLLRPLKKVDSLLHITKMYSTFEIFEDEATALASFK
jgi:anti-sigma B factor antagonist